LHPCGRQGRRRLGAMAVRSCEAWKQKAPNPQPHPLVMVDKASHQPRSELLRHNGTDSYFEFLERSAKQGLDGSAVLLLAASFERNIIHRKQERCRAVLHRLRRAGDRLRNTSPKQKRTCAADRQRTKGFFPAKDLRGEF